MTTKILAAAVFVAVIATPVTLWLVGAEAEPLQNRALIQAPTFTPTRILDDDMYEQLGDYLEDHTPLRAQAVDWNARVRLVLGDSTNPDVIIGHNGWLYFTPAVDAPCVGWEQIDQVADAVALLADIGEGAGITVRIIVPPNKATIYPQHLPEAHSPACAEQNRAALFARIEPMIGSVVLNPIPALQQSGPATYHRRDTHWNRWGAAIAAAALVDNLQPDLWEPDALEITVTEPRLSDLEKLLGLDSGYDTQQRWDAAREGRIRRDVLLLDQGLRLRMSQTEAATRYEPRSIFLHDSFGEVLLPLLQPYFADLAAVRSYDLERPEVSDAAADAETLIVEIVERSIYGPATADLVSDLLAMVGDRLPHLVIELDGVQQQTQDMTFDSDSGGLRVTGPEPRLAFGIPPGTSSRLFLLADVSSPQPATVHVFPEGTDSTTRISTDVRQGNTIVAIELTQLREAETLMFDPGPVPGLTVISVRVVEVAPARWSALVSPLLSGR